MSGTREWAKRKALAVSKFFRPRGYFPLWWELQCVGTARFVVGETLSQLQIQVENSSGNVSVRRVTQAEKRALRRQVFRQFETWLQLQSTDKWILPYPLAVPDTLAQQLMNPAHYTIYDKIIALVQWWRAEPMYILTHDKNEWFF